MIWLGERRGYLADWSTQLWVRSTGRRVSLRDAPWLSGPVGGTRRIGGDSFRHLAEREGLTVLEGPGARGLVSTLDCLDGPDFPSSLVAPGVREFYQRTGEYELDAWSEWCGAFKPFGWLLSALFSRRLQQLNVPLSGLDTSRGLSNEVWHLVDPDSGLPRYVVWVRHLRESGTTVYAGSYGPCTVPGWNSPCLKVIFPLPNGNAVVILKPVLHDDGSASFVSSGRRFGDPGFYFTVHRGEGVVSARYVPTMRETIRVFESAAGETRADHTMTIWRLVFLRLHYRMRRHEART
jgi:hypothetical protein